MAISFQLADLKEKLKKKKIKLLSLSQFSALCGYSYANQQIYYPGVSLAIVCGVLLGNAKQGQGLTLTVHAFVVVGPNSEAESLSTVICLAIERVFGMTPSL